MLILDGLDHVWRINAEDKRPLDDLFCQVIPCPENMVLLVGTQPVNDEQLPADLLAFAPKSEWHTLPAMSESAVLSYLRRTVQEGWLTTGFESEEQIEEQLQSAASALRKKTNGHPLHVIYATSELKHSGRRLSSWDIEQLKGDLSQDARFYYVNRPGFPGECFICELRLPDHRFRWKHNKLFLLLPEEYGPAFPAIVDCYTSPPT